MFRNYSQSNIISNIRHRCEILTLKNSEKSRGKWDFKRHKNFVPL